MNGPNRIAGTAGMCAMMAGAAMGQGQPTLYMTSFGQDLSADGQTIIGSVYDGARDLSPVFRMVRGGAPVVLGQRGVSGASIYANADGTRVAADMVDIDNAHGFGNDAEFAHVWNGSEWINLGLGEGGTACGSSVNGAWGLADESGEVVVSGWSTSDCGPFRTWMWSPVTQAYTALPASNSGAPQFRDAEGTRANAISASGDVVAGWDLNVTGNEEWPSQHPCVWQRDAQGAWTQTILDPMGGTADVVSGDGRVVVGKMSPETMLATFGTEETTPVAWILENGVWTPHNLGGSPAMRATSASYDGATIVGHKFVWRESINNGVAMDLDAFVADRGASFPGLEIGTIRGSAVSALSADGGSVIVRTIDDRNPCLSTFGIGVLDLDGAPCVAPSIVFDPVSQQVSNPPTEFYGVILNVFVAGTWDIQYRWQKEIQPGLWTDLEDDGCEEFLPEFFDYKGVSGAQLRIGYLSGQWNGNYRCVITNACGSVTSAVATIDGACSADFNGDGFLDFFDYGDYVDCFETGTCPDGKTADFNGDQFVDFFDYEAFVTAFETGC